MSDEGAIDFAECLKHHGNAVLTVAGMLQYVADEMRDDLGSTCTIGTSQEVLVRAWDEILCGVDSLLGALAEQMESLEHEQRASA